MPLDMYPRRYIAAGVAVVVLLAAGVLVLLQAWSTGGFGAFCNKYHKQCLKKCADQHMFFDCSDNFLIGWHQHCGCSSGSSSSVDSLGMDQSKA